MVQWGLPHPLSGLGLRVALDAPQLGVGMGLDGSTNTVSIAGARAMDQSLNIEAVAGPRAAVDWNHHIVAGASKRSLVKGVLWSSVRC